jgi:hypothetical protein
MATFMDVQRGFTGVTAQQLKEPDGYVFEREWYTRCDAY